MNLEFAVRNVEENGDGSRLVLSDSPCLINRLDGNCSNTFENIKQLADFPLKSKNVVMQRKEKTCANDLSLDDDTTDVTLIVNNQKINAHKDVLSSNSPYFEIMFTGSFKERHQDKIEINITDISFETLKTLIEYFYKSVLCISEQNVQELMIGSNIFFLDDVGKTCVDYMKTLIDVENCFSMKNFAVVLYLKDLYSSCLTFMINNFRLVCNHEMFLTVSYDEIMLLIQNDDLYAKEDMVYDVVMKWIKHDPLTRSKYSTDLLWYVRMPLVLNTYQGDAKISEFQGARINGLSSFRSEHRKPFRKGILVLGRDPKNSFPVWYDAGSDQWHNYNCKNCATTLVLPQYLCSCVLLDNGRLFAVGGFLNEKGLKSANLFNPKTKTWTLVQDMSFPRVRPYVVQIGSKVYVIGGCPELELHNTNVGHIEYYDLKKNVWVPINYSFRGISFLRNDTFVTSVNDLIYIIGWDKSGFFNPQEKSWCPIPELPERRENAAVCTLDTSIYVIGGLCDGIYLKSVWVYCTETHVWTRLADMNSRRSHSVAAVMNGSIYVFGGKSDDCNSSHSTFELYHPVDDEWKPSNVRMLASDSPNQCNIDAVVIDKNSVFFKEVFEDSTNNINH